MKLDLWTLEQHDFCLNHGIGRKKTNYQTRGEDAPKLEKRAAHVRLERHPAKIQKVKKWSVKKYTFRLSTFRLFFFPLTFSTFRLFGFSSSLSTLNGLSFVLLAAHVQRKRSKKEQKGCRHLLFLRLGRAYARFWWRNFRWWNFRWRGVRWSVRKTCWVSVGPIRLLFFFEECCWCQTDLRDHFPYKHLHRFRLASELWVCLLILHFQF